MPTRPTNKIKTPSPNTGREGSVFLTSTGAIHAPIITAAKLKQYSKNFYGAGVAKKLLALFFGDKLEIQALDKTGEQDEDLQKEIENMVTAREVSLFSKMKVGWLDRFWLGLGIFNPVWEEQGALWNLKELRRLPPESFSLPPQSVGFSTVGTDAAVPGEILKGVVAMPEKLGGKIRYFQTRSDGTQTELTKIYVIKDTTSTDVAGDPEIRPVVPIITMLDFAWASQMKKDNRVGAPILLLRIINAKGDDVAYGQKLIKNWGSDTGFLLRSNMEIVDFNPADTSTALDTINKLTEMILDYWVPTNLLSKNGQLIGGNSNSDLSLLYSYIAGMHREIEAEWEPLIQIYLDANGYEGYRIKLHIPDPEIDDSALKTEQAKVGADTGLLTENEVRTRLGAQEMTEEELAELPIRKKEQKAEEEAARKEDAARMQAEALRAGQQPVQQTGQPGQQTGNLGPQGGPGRGNQGGPQANTPPPKKGAKIAAKNQPEQFKHSRPYYWPDEPNQGDPAHAHDQDPDPSLTKIMNKEEAQLDLALDALARAVLAKL